MSQSEAAGEQNGTRMEKVTGIGGVFAWITDPDGNKIELWEPKIWDEKNKK